MSRLVKIGLVAGGYVVSFLAAVLVVYFYDLSIPPADSQAMGGMYAFSELVLFVGTFGLVALVPTGLALYFLRPFPELWTGISVAALVLAFTGPVGAALNSLANHGMLSGLAGDLAGLGFLRAAGAPLVALTFVVCAVVAPDRRSRRALIGAAIIEGASSAYAVLWVVLH